VGGSHNVKQNGRTYSIEDITGLKAQTLRGEVLEQRFETRAHIPSGNM
jgi:hypothetical protein